MCGIAGGLSKPDISKIKSRGPDNTGDIIVDDIHFIHTRLAIIDLSENSNQPMDSPEYTMTYNGEWYNYKDNYNLQSDTLALFQSLHDNGFENTLNMINGMFALAVYDKLLDKIYCAVDRFGQKPLYYREEPFMWASNPGALYPDGINREALKTYWALGSTMGCIWKNIKQLGASDMLIYDIETKKIEVRRWYTPKFYDNAERDIEELVLDAINTVKISDVPVHIFLSGGIDSTLVASQFKGGNAIHLSSPEKEYAAMVAKKFDINLIEVNPSGYDVEECLTDYSKCGEPSMAALIPYITCKEMSKFGKVAISANGADELFFGYDRTHDDITEQQIRHTYRDLGYSFLHPFYTSFNGKTNGRMWELGGYVGFDLNKTLDFASMAHGVEVRCPFLDHRLVECALSIPEKVHRKKGNKTILKNILLKMGFDNKFVNRPKVGFSLHYKPENLDSLIDIAVAWCLKEGWLEADFNKLSGRDKQYLSMSALSYYYWYRGRGSPIS